MSIKEESHTLREWQEILANNPELMAEFEVMTPPTPIKGDISEQPVSDHHEIEVEFRGEKVTIGREFYRDGERNYSTSEQDDNAIWAALRAWCEEKGITPFELYPKKSEQPVEGLEEAAVAYSKQVSDGHNFRDLPFGFIAGAEWQREQMMDEWLKDRDGCFWDGVEEGKKAMEKQMMDEAVEGEVVKDINNKLGAVTAKNVNLDKFKFGDKVKILVIKDEGK